MPFQIPVRPYLLVAKVALADQTNFPQQIGFDPVTGNLYLTQAEKAAGADFENLTISRFVNYQFDSMMTGLRGHGTPLLVEHDGGQTYLTFPYRGATGGDRWVRLPFIAGHQWTSAEALSAQYRTDALPKHPPTPPYWMQGEVEFANAIFRVIGGPYNTNGPIPQTPPTPAAEPAHLQAIRNGAVVKTIDAAILGRVNMELAGAPVNGRLEPEGLALWYWNMAPNLVIAIANGRADNDSLLLRVFRYELDRATYVGQDVPHTVPVGTTIQVGITMHNAGETTWTPGLHSLAEGRWSAFQPGVDTDPWTDVTFRDLPQPVPPGGTVTIRFPVTATLPLADFQWQMVRDPWNNRHFFGDQSPRTHIRVTPPPH